MSDSLQPHGLYSPWNSPGQNTGIGSVLLLQGIFPSQGLNPDLTHRSGIPYQLSHKGSPGLLWWISGKESAGQCRRCEFNPWVGKTPWRRKWWSTWVFFPGKSHGQRSQVGYSSRGSRKVGNNLATKQNKNNIIGYQLISISLIPVNVNSIVTWEMKCRIEKDKIGSFLLTKSACFSKLNQFK